MLQSIMAAATFLSTRYVSVLWLVNTQYKRLTLTNVPLLSTFFFSITGLLREWNSEMCVPIKGDWVGDGSEQCIFLTNTNGYPNTQMSCMSQLRWTHESYCTKNASAALCFLHLGFCSAPPFYPKVQKSRMIVKKKSHPYSLPCKNEQWLNSDPCCEQ